MLHQQPGLPEHLGLGQQAEFSLPHPVVQGRPGLHHQRQHADILRVHGVEGLRRLDGVALQQLRPAQAGDGGDGEGHAAPADFLAHLYDLRGHVALVHQSQHIVAAGLQPHVDHGEALVPQGPQLLLRPDADGGRGCVAGDPLALRKQLPDGVQDGIKFTCFPDQGVPVRQEDPAHPGVGPPGQAEVLQHLLQRPDGEPLLLVHAAEGAGVVAAPVGHLDDEAVCLGGGAVDAAVVSHTPSFSRAAIFRHTHSTAMACSSSSTGGRDGAMRMLESWGSLP